MLGFKKMKIILSIHFYRLQERYEGLPSKDIPAEAIYIRFREEGGTIDRKVIGKYIGQVFSNVHVSRRYNSIKSKDELFYLGLSERTYISSEISDFTFVKQWVQFPFFVSHEDSSEIHISMLCDTTINGNRIIKKIVLHNNGTWDMYIAECKLDLESYNIQNTYVASRQCIQNVCSIAFKLKLCNGKEKGKHC
jgi:hypothetical protein